MRARPCALAPSLRSCRRVAFTPVNGVLSFKASGPPRRSPGAEENGIHEVTGSMPVSDDHAQHALLGGLKYDGAA